VVAPGVDPALKHDLVAVILGTKLATGVRAAGVRVLRNEIGTRRGVHGREKGLVDERSTTEEEMRTSLKPTSPNDRVNARFVLTVNLDV